MFYPYVYQYNTQIQIQTTTPYDEKNYCLNCNSELVIPRIFNNIPVLYEGRQNLLTRKFRIQVSKYLDKKKKNHKLVTFSLKNITTIDKNVKKQNMLAHGG